MACGVAVGAGVVAAGAAGGEARQLQRRAAARLAGRAVLMAGGVAGGARSVTARRFGCTRHDLCGTAAWVICRTRGMAARGSRGTGVAATGKVGGAGGGGVIIGRGRLLRPLERRTAARVVETAGRVAVGIGGMAGVVAAWVVTGAWRQEGSSAADVIRRTA